MESKIFRLVGLARRAGKVAVGTAIVEKMVRRNKVKLLLFAVDASLDTIDKVLKLQPGCPHIFYGAKHEWGAALGSEAFAVLGLLEQNFVDGILQQYEVEKGEGEVGGTI